MPPNVIASTNTSLNAEMTALRKMLKVGHTFTESGSVWYVDNKLAFWPATGKYKFSMSKGGKSGKWRGRAESIFEQIESELRAV